MPKASAKRLPTSGEDGKDGKKDVKDDASPRVPKLTGTSKLFVQRMLQFFVAVAIGLAPFLGKISVPGFSALLEMFPRQLQNGLLPLSSILMGAIVVTTDFLLAEKPTTRKRARLLLFSFASVAMIGLVGLLITYSRAVAQISIDGGARTATFMVGFPPREYAGDICPTKCAGRSAADCIKSQLSLSTDVITTCFGEDKVSSAGLVYSFLYLCVMGALAAMVSLGILTSRDKGRKTT